MHNRLRNKNNTICQLLTVANLAIFLIKIATVRIQDVMLSVLVE